MMGRGIREWRRRRRGRGRGELKLSNRRKVCG
jgi:hypothetical protein